MDNRSKYSYMKYLALGTYLAFTIASTLLTGMYIGYYLDKRLGTGTVMTFAFSFLGLTTGLRVLYKTVLDIGRNERKSAGEGGEK